MAQLAIRQPWRKQPTFAVGIDESNPLTHGLVMAMNVGTGIDPVLRNVLREAARSSGAAYTTYGVPVPRQYERITRSTTGATNPTLYIFKQDQANKDLIRPHLEIVGPMTFLAEHIYPPSLNGTNSTYGSAGWHEGGWVNQLRFSSAQANTFYNPSAAASSIDLSGGVTIADGKPHIWGLTYDGDGVGTGTVRGYLDGRERNSASSIAQVSYSSTFGYNGVKIDPYCTLMCVWDRQLSDEEVLSFCLNPWQIFSPIIIPGIRVSGVSTQSLTQDSTFSDSESFPAASVAHVLPQGAVAQNTQSFGAATIHQGLTGGLFSNSQDFPAASVVHALQAPLFQETETFHGATLHQGLEAATFSNTQSFPAATFTTYLTQDSRFDDTESFPGSAVDHTIESAKFSNSQDFFAPQINHHLTADFVPNVQDFIPGSISTPLEASLVENTQQFFGAQIDQTVSVGIFQANQNHPGSTITLALVQDAGFEDNQTFFGPSVGDTLVPAVFSNTQSFPGAATHHGLTAGLAQNSNTFLGGAIVFPATADLAQNTQAFFAAQADQTTASAKFSNTQDFPAGTVTLHLSAELAENTQAFPESEILNGDFLDAELAENTQAFPAATVTLGLTAAQALNTQAFPEAEVIKFSDPATISGVAIDRLAEVWARVGLDAARPVVNTPTSIAFGPISQRVSENGADRTGAPIVATEDVDTMVLEVWQRLGLDADHPLVQGAASISVDTIDLAVTTAGSRVTVQRQ